MACILTNIFSHSIGCHFILLMVSYTVEKLLLWCNSICFHTCKWLSWLNHISFHHMPIFPTYARSPPAHWVPTCIALYYSSRSASWTTLTHSLSFAQTISSLKYDWLEAPLLTWREICLPPKHLQGLPRKARTSSGRLPVLVSIDSATASQHFAPCDFCPMPSRLARLWSFQPAWPAQCEACSSPSWRFGATEVTTLQLNRTKPLPAEHHSSCPCPFPPLPGSISVVSPPWAPAPYHVAHLLLFFPLPLPLSFQILSPNLQISCSVFTQRPFHKMVYYMFW